MGDFVVYMITYMGDKHPPLYIGSTSKERIANGYLGSPTSMKWGDVVKLEQKENPHLYRIEILSDYLERHDALVEELNIQKELGVVKDSKYFNESLACPNGFFGRDVTGRSNPRYGCVAPENVKLACSQANKGKVTVSFDDGKTWRKVSKEFYRKNNAVLITPKGEFNHNTTEATRRKVADGTHHFCDPTVQERIREKRGKIIISESQRSSVSSNMKNYYGNWLNKQIDENVELWKIALEIHDFFHKHDDIVTPRGKIKRSFVADLLTYIKTLGVDPRESVRGWDKVFSKLKNGWNPREDQAYLYWRNHESK